MPVMDGFESSTILRNMMDKQEIPEIPIVACTAYTDKEKISNCYLVGMNDHLAKPVTTLALSNILRKYIDIQEVVKGN